LLVHGLAVSHRYLMPTARQLSTRRVLVPDLPGFGLSTKPPRIYPVDAHAQVLARWLEMIAVGPVCLVGNSFGCQVAVTLSVERPDLVGAVVLIGPTVDPAARSIVGQALRWVHDAVYEDKRQAAILAADLRDAGMRRVFGTLALSVADRIEPKLPRLRVPTLLMRGARDRVAPQRWISEAARLTTGSTAVVIAGAAHNVVTTAGPEVAAAIDAFITDAGVGRWPGTRASGPHRA
jgi:pimeloyl-ACP methyl ester carboxylesterase